MKAMQSEDMRMEFNANLGGALIRDDGSVLCAAFVYGNTGVYGYMAL